MDNLLMKNLISDCMYLSDEFTWLFQSYLMLQTSETQIMYIRGTAPNLNFDLRSKYNLSIF